MTEHKFVRTAIILSKQNSQQKDFFIDEDNQYQ